MQVSSNSGSRKSTTNSNKSQLPNSAPLHHQHHNGGSSTSGGTKSDNFSETPSNSSRPNNIGNGNNAPSLASNTRLAASMSTATSNNGSNTAIKKDKVPLINNSKTSVTTSSADKTNKLVGTVPPLEKGVSSVSKVVPVAPSK